MDAAGTLSLEPPMPEHGHFIEVPYLRGGRERPRQKIERIAVDTPATTVRPPA